MDSLHTVVKYVVENFTLNNIFFTDKTYLYLRLCFLIKVEKFQEKYYLLINLSIFVNI